MNRPTLINSPFLVGFEHFERVAEHLAKASGDGYPPYNIERTGAEQLRITLAVAGFAIEDLTVSLEDRQLVVRGRKRDDDQQRVYLHRGIAARQFQRFFVLAECIEIKGANLDNGLLHIDLERIVPDAAVRTIAIAKGSRATTVGHQKTIDAGLDD